MKDIKQQDTIVAIGTAAGDGGIAIVRISGSEAKKIAKAVLNQKTQLIDRMAVLTTLQLPSVQDEVLALYFKAPRSYTGEDVVEIQCHGSYFLAGRIVEGLIEKGCRMAEAGEFTRRAFCNGRMDLTRCEAVLDFIHAQSDAGARAAYAALKGGLYDIIEPIQSTLISLIASASVAVDYPEEDLTEPLMAELMPKIKELLHDLEALKETYRDGVLLRDGVRTAIVGEPNVGKSLLLNRLIGRDRSIVTDTAGTTRDTVEENFLYKGIKFLLIDTAGIRSGVSDEVERQGIARSKLAAQTSDLILAVSAADDAPYRQTPQQKATLTVYNKMDLCQNLPTCDENAICVSAKTGENLNRLKEKMYEMTAGKISASGAKLSNLRHLQAVTHAIEALKRITQAQTHQMDCFLSDLNDALRAIGSITGIHASDEVIAEIFSKFCVGK